MKMDFMKNFNSDIEKMMEENEMELKNLMQSMNVGNDKLNQSSNDNKSHDHDDDHDDHDDHETIKKKNLLV